MDKWLLCVVALILGMLMFHMLKSVCGCKTVEGNSETHLNKFIDAFQKLMEHEKAEYIAKFNSINISDIPEEEKILYKRINEHINTGQESGNTQVASNIGNEGRSDWGESCPALPHWMLPHHDPNAKPCYEFASNKEGGGRLECGEPSAAAKREAKKQDINLGPICKQINVKGTPVEPWACPNFTGELCDFDIGKVKCTNFVQGINTNGCEASIQSKNTLPSCGNDNTKSCFLESGVPLWKKCSDYKYIPNSPDGVGQHRNCEGTVFCTEGDSKPCGTA